MLTWRYTITTGRLSLIGEDGSVTPLWTGWAGQGAGKNNPDACDQHNKGPLPPGVYTIGEPFDDPHTGPFSMNLRPDPANEMHGRSGFRIHGASRTHPETSSQGCIIMPRPVRERVHASGCRRLEVVR